jgi:tetratricopeptide (TPR) repeat protein
MRFLTIPLVMTLLVTPWSSLLAQSARSLIKEGNRAYEEEDFTGAEVQYRKVLEVDKDLVEGSFNLGDALYKQGNFDGSTRAFEEAASVSKEDEMTAKTFFNKGNALFKQEMYDESIQSYIESLKLNPDDLDAKYNLLYAMRKQREMEDQQSKQDQQSQGGEEGDSEQDQQEKPRAEDDQSGEDEEGSPAQGEREESEQEADEVPPVEPEDEQISRSEAERILQALKENEREIQKKLREKPGGRVRVEKDW